jgi:hypothetical protein
MKGVVDDKMVSSAFSILKRSSVLWEAQIAILTASIARNITAMKLVTDGPLDPASLTRVASTREL